MFAALALVQEFAALLMIWKSTSAIREGLIKQGTWTVKPRKTVIVLSSSNSPSVQGEALLLRSQVVMSAAVNLSISKPSTKPVDVFYSYPWILLIVL